MTYSVVIPTCNRPDRLAVCLSNLRPGFQSGFRCRWGEDALREKADYEVIVTDDGDGVSGLSNKYPWVNFVKGPGRGPAANRNHGATFARGEWIVFLDDDCIPIASWLAGFYAQRNKALVLEGKTVTDRPRRRLDEEAPENLAGGYLWSCNFAITRKVFNEMHGFDEDFLYAAMEDVEFHHRISMGCISVAFCAGAEVCHPWRMSNNKFYKYRLRSWLLLIQKHPELQPVSICRHGFRYGISIVRPILSPEAFNCRLRGAGGLINLFCLHIFETMYLSWRMDILKQSAEQVTKSYNSGTDCRDH